MLGDPLQRRARADDERGRGPRPGLRPAPDAAPGLDGAGAVLRLLRRLRPAVEPDHDAAEPTRVDEPHRHQRRAHRELHGRHEGGVEFVVRFLSSFPLFQSWNRIANDCSLLRLLLGIVIAGMWPGMAYYLTLFYPPSRTGKRIGQYFTAAQVSAAVVGLVSAGFQKMDGDGGLVGFQWMFLLYGLVTIVVGFLLIWWLPDRPTPPGEPLPERSKYLRWLPRSPPALKGRDAEIHYHDLRRVYHRPQWTLRDLLRVFMDWRLWPLLAMYFGVVGVGIGVQNYGTVIIKATNPKLTDIQLSLLFAPIWIVRSTLYSSDEGDHLTDW